LLPSLFLKSVGICLLAFGFYDTNVYRYALRTGRGTFDFFGRAMRANHKVIRLGFSIVLLFYYSVGLILIIFG
jgi:hypothetical protein